MVREKTSNVIRDTNLSVKVTRKTDEQTEFTLNLYVKPIIGGARREVIKRSFANDLLTKDTLYDLREGKIITAPEYRVLHIGEMDGCDMIKVDEMPDDEEVQNLYLVVKFCDAVDKIVGVDAAFRAAGRNLVAGYDLVRR